MNNETNCDYLSQLVAHSQDILYRINLDNMRFVYVSKSVEQICGYTVEEVFDTGILFPQSISTKLSGFSRREEIFAQIQQGIVPDSSFTIIDQITHKNGSLVWYCERGNIVTDSKGKAVAVLGSVRDITNEKKLEISLRESNQRYEDLYNNAKVALFKTRVSDSIFIEGNTLFKRFIGLKSDESVEGVSALSLYCDADDREKLLERLLTIGHISSFEFKFTRKDGCDIWAKMNARLCDKDTTIEGAVFDITAHKILTDRERVVLGFVIDGFSNKEIAYKLKRSIRTIEDQRRSLMRKLGVDNLVDLIKRTKEMWV